MSQEIENVIFKLADHLNSNHVLWGIGGSYLLKSHSIKCEVHDLDLLISESDLEIVVEILNQIAKRKDIPFKTEYKTAFFAVYDMDGVSIDVMSRFRIEHDQGIYEFPFESESIVKIIGNGREVLPLTSLEDWLVAYHLKTAVKSKSILCSQSSSDMFSNGAEAPPPALLTNMSTLPK